MFVLQSVASTRVQSWGDEPPNGEGCGKGTPPHTSPPSVVRWEGSGQPILVCYIRKYVIILGDIPVDVPPTKILGDVSPASPSGLTPVTAVTLHPSVYFLSSGSSAAEVGFYSAGFTFFKIRLETLHAVHNLSRLWVVTLVTSVEPRYLL